MPQARRGELWVIDLGMAQNRVLVSYSALSIWIMSAR